MKAGFIKYLIAFTLIIGFYACNENRPKKILFINSYHEGYPSSDEITEAVRNRITDADDELKIVYMDCKRNTSPGYAKNKASEIMNIIEEFQPDGIIVSDDDAVKYVIEPYVKNTETPVSFCGVNWDCSQYGLPCDNVTGILEVLPLEELIGQMKISYPNIRTLAVLSENTVSEQNNKRLLDSLYRKQGLEPSYFLVDDFRAWKDTFKYVNHNFDLIYMPTNGAIKEWNNDEASVWVEEHILKPVVTCDDFMMKWCVFGLTKIASEQGDVAMDVLYEMINDKKQAADIPVTKNVKHKSWINEKLATKIKFNTEGIDYSLAEKYK